MNIVSHSPLLSQALAYAKRTWKVFPLYEPIAIGVCSCGKHLCEDKHPRTTHGFKDATTDASTTTQWWTKWQNANIAIATGSASNVFVLDVDGEEGKQTLAQWAREGLTLPPTLMASSGRIDGVHYYLTYPQGSGLSSKSKVYPGIDYRGEGGYIVAPPSVHINGKQYAWQNENALAECPQWLVDKLKTKPSSLAVNAKPNIMRVASSEDLDTHAGAKAGQRNELLCRLAGIHLARGESLETIKEKVSAWLTRSEAYGACDYDKAMRSLNSLWEKHNMKLQIAEVRIEEVSDDCEEEPLPEPKRMPTPSLIVYEGVIGKMVRTLEPETEADSIAILLSVFCAFGNAIGRTAHCKVGATLHYCNLFVLGVGKTAQARKGLANDTAMALMPKDEWKSKCLATGLSSGEGVIWAIRDAQQKLDEGVLQTLDAGVSDKRLFVREEEFSKPLACMKREGNTLADILKNAWDGKILRTLTRSSPCQASEPHLSIFAWTTPETLRRTLPVALAEDGFINRFLIACVRRTKLIPSPKAIDYEALGKPIVDAIAFAKSVGEMKRAPEAETLWETMYREMETEERNGIYGLATLRASAQTLRLAMLYALTAREKIIGVKHLQSAYALWKYCEASARYIFGETPTLSPLASKVLGVIKSKEGISRTGIHEALNRNYSATLRNQALAELMEQEQAYCVSEGKSERWYAGSTPYSPTPPEPEPTPGEYREYGSRGVVEPTPGATPAEAKAETEAKATPAEGEGMAFTDFLVAVKAQGGRIAYDAKALRYEVQGMAMTPAIEQALETHKDDLWELEFTKA